jgi:hypothetical protein
MALLLYMQEALGSSLSMEITILIEGSLDFPQSIHVNARVVPKVCHNTFLPYLFQFIVH